MFVAADDPNKQTNGERNFEGLCGSPYFCVFKYARAIKQNVTRLKTESETRERCPTGV